MSFGYRSYGKVKWTVINRPAYACVLSELLRVTTGSSWTLKRVHWFTCFTCFRCKSKVGVGSRIRFRVRACFSKACVNLCSIETSVPRISNYGSLFSSHVCPKDPNIYALMVRGSVRARNCYNNFLVRVGSGLSLGLGFVYSSISVCA